MKYADIVSTPTPQSEALDERQSLNHAGGFVYSLDVWKRLDRFLVLGSDSSTYYQTARALTRENSQVVTEAYAEDASRTVAVIVGVSDAGRSPKNDSAIFALALGAASANEVTRQIALGALARVCRTSTHLFQFLKVCEALGRGWGRALKNAVAAWYSAKSVEAVGYQAIKYRQREGFTHKRAPELSHAPAATDPVRQNLYRWIKGKVYEEALLPKQVKGHLLAQTCTSTDVMRSTFPTLVESLDLPWEALPTEANAIPEVWQAMVPKMGLTALIRNLGNMTRIGAIKPLSSTEAGVVARLTDETDLRRSRVHPFAVLQALAVYRSGAGFRGSGTWTPSGPVLAALGRAFYAAFANVVPTGKRHLLALDVSGSMTSPFGGSVLTCREASAALALVTMNVEPATHVVGFTSAGHADRRYGGMWGGGQAELTVLPISPREGLAAAIKATANLPFGGTDCALPMIYARERGLQVDAFVVLTDNETWAGATHPMEALRAYRKASGIPAKLVVVGMTATSFSIADPQDGGSLDVVGFDGNCPSLIADFIRG